MSKIKFVASIKDVDTKKSNELTFIPSKALMAVKLNVGENILPNLPRDITGVTDLNLTTFTLWRNLAPILSNPMDYFGGEATIGINVREVNGVNIARAIAVKEYGTLDRPVDYQGKATLLMGNIQNINMDGVERKQLGSLITIIPATYKPVKVRIENTDYDVFAAVVDKRPTETYPTYIKLEDVRDPVYEKSNTALTSINIRDVALFNRSNVCYLLANGSTHVFNTGLLSGSALNIGRVMDTGLANYPNLGFGILALKTTGANVKNTFADNVPYPRIINVQTLDANRDGYSIKGYTLTVAASLGIDLTDSDKYMFMTNVIDATTMSSIYIGDEHIVETSRTPNKVEFGGFYSNPVSGTQYLWVAIVQMYA